MFSELFLCRNELHYSFSAKVLISDWAQVFRFFCRFLNRISVTDRLLIICILLYFQTQKEAETLVEDLCVSNLVTLTNSDRADIRISNNDPSGRTLERKVEVKKVAEFVLKILGTSDNVTSNSSTKYDSKSTGA